MNNLKNRLIKARLAKDLTQEELARAAGVSQVTIQHLESGRNKSSRKLVDIAKALGVTAEYLSNDTSVQSYIDEGRENIVSSDIDFLLASSSYNENSPVKNVDQAKLLADRIARHYAAGDLSDSFIDAVNSLIDCYQKKIDDIHESKK